MFDKYISIAFGFSINIRIVFCVVTSHMAHIANSPGILLFLKKRILEKIAIISYKLPSDRLNNHSRSRELITFLYDVADL